MKTKKMTPKHVYVIAGEQSGDALGASLMAALRTQHGDAIRFSGIGGPKMEAAGLRSLFPMKELALMGFAEIIPHLPRLFKRIRQTVDDIAQQQPDMVITIDSPGFNKQVAKRVKKLTPRPKLVHYVAPSVWAYKPDRAKKFAQIYDHLLALLPFEPPYFTAEDLPCTFVGHPLMEKAVEFSAEQKQAFRARHNIASDAPFLLVLPGSRSGELKRHLPLMETALHLLKKQLPGLRVAIPSVPHLQEELKKHIANWPCQPVLIDANEDKFLAYASADVALSKSGTVTLELALTHTPMVVMYVVHPLSAWLIRRMMRTPFVTLVNILRVKPVIPELIQEIATPENLATEVLTLFKVDGEAARQVAEFQPALEALGLNAPRSPAVRAADVVSNLLAKT